MSISKGYDAILAQGFPASYIHHMMKSVNDTDSDIAVRVENLRVRRGGHEILHGLDVALSTGTVTGLLGPSGCGKTTLMRALVGVQRYEGGVAVLGHVPGAPDVRDRIGYVTQSAAVYKDLTARQNLRYFASLAGSRMQGVDEALEVVGLTALADRRVSTYSGGVANPELLVLDEPTVGLDPVTREDLWEAFRAIAARGTTILVSSHVMDEAFRCDAVLLMREGRLLATTTASELLERTGGTTLDDAFLRLIRSAERTARAPDAAPIISGRQEVAR